MQLTMTQDRILSGSLLLSAGSGFGASSLAIVSGETPTGGSGQVQITLAPEHCSLAFANSVSIRLDEEHARKLATSMQETCVRLEHLRALHQLSKLDPSRVVANAAEQQLPRAYPQATGASATMLLELPTPREVPVFTWSAESAMVSYVSMDGRQVRVAFSVAACVRRLPSPADVTAGVFRVMGDPWWSKNIEADPRDSEFEHFAACFPGSSFELIATQFAVQVT